MQEFADDTRPDDTATDAAEQPARAAAEAAPASQRRARIRFQMDGRAFVRVNARMLIILGLFATGVVFVILGWYGAAHTNIATEQVPYLISGGLLGLGLIIVAGVMAAGAAQERSTDDLRREIARIVATMGSVTSDRSVRTDTSSANGHSVFVVTGGRSYHEAGCPILEGKKGVKELEPAQAVASGYAACKLCGRD
jgi:hypothetical protein